MPKIAIVVSEFNAMITERLLTGAMDYLKENTVGLNDIYVVHVPGAVEIPLTTKFLAAQQKYQAIIALGCVIRGDTDHYQYVCDQVSQGCQQVMLQYNIPIIFGVLTTQTEAQALARVGGAEGHKGREAASAALQMLEVVQALALDA